MTLKRFSLSKGTDTLRYEFNIFREQYPWTPYSDIGDDPVVTSAPVGKILWTLIAHRNLAPFCNFLHRNVWVYELMPLFRELR